MPSKVRVCSVKMERGGKAYLVTAFGEIFEGGEALHFDIFNLVSCGIHLGNDDFIVVLELLAQLVPDGGQLLAVSAPGGICGRAAANS